MRKRLRRARRAPDAPEVCAAIGCVVPCGAGKACCDQHWAELPAHEQVRFFEAMEASLVAPDVQRARLAARGRVGAVLRGVRA